MMASVWMLTTDMRACLTSCTNDVGAPGTGTTTGATARGSAIAGDSTRDGFSTHPTTSRLRASRRHILHPEVVEQVGQKLLLFVAEVAARLVLQHPEDVDGLLRQRQVALAGFGMGNFAEVHQ